MKTLKAEAFPVTQHFYVNLAGEYEKGVDHLTNAIAVCGQPNFTLNPLYYGNITTRK